MRSILANPTFRALFSAQVIALLGTGLLTIALALLAFDIAGSDAGIVLGIALTIKMLAYVIVAPVMSAAIAGFNRRTVMISADLIRVGVALSLPFVEAAWQIYLLIFLLQCASATFTPTFQATIPDVLPDEGAYTRALSLSRLAFDIESLISPTLAALLLLVLAPSALFGLTALGFLGSAWLIFRTPLPDAPVKMDRPFHERVTRGSRIYLATPRLRGLFALGGTVSAVGAVIIVQSVVIAKGIYGGSEQALAILLGAYGLGSMVTALALPALLERVRDRAVMVTAGFLLSGLGLATGLWATALGWPEWPVLLVIWCGLGAANTAILTPAGRLLRHSAHAEDRPAIFAAQFALSHALWLLAYPLAGVLGAGLGVAWALVLLSSVGVAAAVTALWIWPSDASDEIEHSHDDLPADHPHLKDAVRRGGSWVHRHTFVIDDEHRVWPTSG